MIEVRNLEKEYRYDSVVVPVLKGVNFFIKKGEFVAIEGASGSGKSTLLNILGFLDKPTGGQYFFKEKEISRMTKDEMAYLRNQEIGFVFQSYNLLPRTTVLENVLLPTIYNPRLSKKEARQRALKLLDKLGLSHRINHHPNQLSGGESQRTAIARALINDPSLILADEPTGNLGYQHTGPVMKIFQDLQKEGNTIILVTHSEEIAGYAQRRLHLVKGIIQENPPDNFKQPR